MLPTFSFTFFKDFLTNQPRKYLYNASHTVLYTAILKKTTLFWPHGATWKLHYMPQGRTELVQEIFRCAKAIFSAPFVKSFLQNIYNTPALSSCSHPCCLNAMPRFCNPARKKGVSAHTSVSLLLQLSVVLSKVWEDWRSCRKYKELFLKK